MSKKIAFLTLLLSQTYVALAYIDPGTGGIIAGSVWPVILAVFGFIGGFFIKYFYKPVKSGVKQVWEKIKRD